MKKLFFLLMTVIVATASAMAQGTITGTVVQASDDEPILGATVLVTATGQGTSTDLDGKFTIKAAEGAIATVKFLGYEDQQVKLTNGIVIKLKEGAATLLDEVVVTGYGSTKKLGSFVGAASVVNSEAIENTPSANFVDALQGQVAGLAIYSNTGEPTSTPAEINIRGINSLEFSSTPLFILDGAPVSSAVFTALNPNDIESVTVLKDAASTAIYGSRAGNGVIVITSKKGKLSEQAKVTLRASLGWSQAVQSKIEMMNSSEYLLFRDRMAKEMGATPIGEDVRSLINDYGFDFNWRDIIFDSSAPTYKLEGAVQGGSEKSNYYLSLGHLDQDGLIARSRLRRESLRASFNADIKPWLKMGFSTNLAYEKYASNSTASYAGNFYTNGPIFQAYAGLPYDAPNFYTLGENGQVTWGPHMNWLQYTFGGTINANDGANVNIGSSNQVTTNTSIYEQLTPIKGLTLRAQQNVYAYDSRGNGIYIALENYDLPNGNKTNMGQYLDRSVSESFSRLAQWTYTNTAEYRRTFGKNEITVLIGQESIINRTHSFGVSIQGQPSNDLMLLTNGDVTTMTSDNISNGKGSYVVNSYFATADWSWDDKYFVNASVRRDGCSKFAPQHRWNTFWALGAMWNIKNEKFLQPYTAVDALQFRANYGTAGNYSGLGNYGWRGVLGTAATYNGLPTMGLAQQSNPDLTWETIEQLSIGVKYGFWNRIYGSVDYYVKNTKDMIINIPYSVTTGWSEGLANIGSLRNQGVDFDFGAHIVKTKDWYVGLKVNFNYNRNTITKLYNGLDEYKLEDYGMVYKIGENPFQLNTVRYVGVDHRDGMPVWLDKNGNETKVYNKDNAVNTGKSYQAPWTGGFGVNASWKGLAVRADFNWAAEKYIFNWAYQQIGDARGMYSLNMCKHMLDVWTPEHPEGNYPSILYQSEGDSRFLENSSFMRLKNLTVSYSLPKSLLNKIYMSDVTFRFTGRNLLTFCADGFTAQDPEYTNNGVRFNYPNTRQYEFGIEVSF